MAKSFSGLQTAQELKERLDNPFRYIRKHVSHYTNLDALLSILSGKKLKFSHFAKTNDPLEYIIMHEETRKKRIFCVMGSSEENFGMWAMYGGLAAKAVAGTEKLDEILKNTFVKIKIPVPSLKAFVTKAGLHASAVAYTKLAGTPMPEKMLCFFGSKSNTNIPFDRSILSGYIKDVAWKYEHEIRIWSESEFVSVDDAFIHSLEVFPSPVITLDECRKLLERDGRYSNVKSTLDAILKENRYQGCFFKK